jgi:hypothetical protein
MKGENERDKKQDKNMIKNGQKRDWKDKCGNYGRKKNKYNKKNKKKY